MFYLTTASPYKLIDHVNIGCYFTPIGHIKMEKLFSTYFLSVAIICIKGKCEVLTQLFSILSSNKRQYEY